MIKSFRHKGLKRFFAAGMTDGIQPAHAARLGRQLKLLDSAKAPKDMDIPGWKLHPLKGAEKGHWSVWVNGNWRLIFAFDDEDAVLVDYRDYHRPIEIRFAPRSLIMARMHNPPHPASILREDILPELGLSVTEAARQLGISRVQLSRVLNERAGISADLALRLEAWLGGPKKGPGADVWMRMQADYDLWQAKQKGAPHVERAVRIAA